MLLTIGRLGLACHSKIFDTAVSNKLPSMKWICLLIAALLVCEAHGASKKAKASGDPKVTSQVCRDQRSPSRIDHAGFAHNICIGMQVFFDIEIDNKPAGERHATVTAILTQPTKAG